MRFCCTSASVFIALLSAASLPAQSGRSYGPSHSWWDAGNGGLLPREEQYDDPDGQIGILISTGAVRSAGHPFFEALGTNGRACITCHQPANAMSLSAASLRQRWTETDGKDPVFAAVDGSNCTGLPQSERSSHSLLLTRAVFRIELPWPKNAEFRIEVVLDPTGCNKSDQRTISLYRRPRVAANLNLLIDGPEGKTFMADARMPSLRAQAINAVMVHEQADSHPTDAQLKQIVDFETRVFASQASDFRGGLLDATSQGTLSPATFAAWTRTAGPGQSRMQLEFRASAARGSDLFFHRMFNGGTCAGCHSSNLTRWMDIGTNNVTPETAAADLPLFKVTCDSGRVVYTQDPGRALISKKCADVGAVVMQQFRGLAARAPYFANGSAGTLRDVIEFYDRRYGIGYTEQEKQDLVNFLRIL